MSAMLHDDGFGSSEASFTLRAETLGKTSKELLRVFSYICRGVVRLMSSSLKLDEAFSIVETKLLTEVSVEAIF